MTTEEIENEIAEEFELFDSWEEKYEYIIDLGKKLKPLDEIHKTDDNRIKGCQSTVWLVADKIGNEIVYRADSDAVIVKGLISMLIRVLSNHTPAEIIHAKLEFISRVGLTSHLAQTRSNGLLSMVKQMKHYAMAYQVKEQAS